MRRFKSIQLKLLALMMLLVLVVAGVGTLVNSWVTINEHLGLARERLQNNLRLLHRDIDQLASVLQRTVAAVASDRDLAFKLISRRELLGGQGTQDLVYGLHSKLVQNLEQVASSQGYDVAALYGQEGLLGYATSDEIRIVAITGQSDEIVLFVHSHERNELLQRLRQQEIVTNFETHLYRSDKSQVIVSINARPVLDARGGLTRIEGSILDISERKAKEHAEQEREKAQAATQAKSEFLARMSHEIRTPINAIKGLLYLVQQEELPAKLRDRLTKMEHSAHALLNIVNDILNFSKIEAGRVELDAVPFDLYAVLDQVRSVVGFRAIEKGLELKFHKDEQLPKHLHGDPNRLAQVLLNLVGNAIKFTERGKVEVFVRALKSSPEQTMLEFSVRDTGIGITPEQQSRLFQVFSQADSSITRRFGGTGLGLAISQRLVDMMGGRITVNSSLGQGSIFRFTAPFGRAEPSEVESTQQPVYEREETLRRLRGAQVLLVEDQPINQEVAREILRWAGLHVQVTSNGQEALRQLQESPTAFDAVLMDLQMPVLDGYEATRRLRADPRFVDLPIIAMTANVLAGERERCLAAGINDYLTKPIEVAKLYDLLQRWIKQPLSSHRSPAAGGLASVDELEQTNAAINPASQLPDRVPGIDLAAGTRRLGGNTALYRKLLGQFPSAHDVTLDTIRAALATGDTDQAAHLAHSLAGVVGNLAAVSLEETTRQLEGAINQGSEEMSRYLADAEAALREVLASIRQLDLDTELTAEILPPNQMASVQQPCDREQWSLQFKELAALLAARDLKAKKQLAELLEKTTDPQIRQQLQPVARQIDCLQFPDALQTLDQIMTSLEPQR